MAISEEEVKKIAQLARIHLSPEEVKKFSLQLEGILLYVAVLSEVNTDGVPVTTQVNGLMDVSRSDEITPWVSREDLLKCSPLPVVDNQIQVPSVFDES